MPQFLQSWQFIQYVSNATGQTKYIFRADVAHRRQLLSSGLQNKSIYPGVGGRGATLKDYSSHFKYQKEKEMAK